MRIVAFSILLGTIVVLCWFLTPTAPETRAALRADDDDDRGPQGVPATFTTLDKTWTGGPDVRLSRLISLYVPEGKPPTPFLPAGPFTVVFEGQLQLDLGDEYTFSAEGRGKLSVALNGSVVLDGTGDLRDAKGKPVRLKKENTIVVRYVSPASGGAAMRLFWESPELRREPVHWKYLRHNPENQALARARQVRDGRELIATQRCLKCHVSAAEQWVKRDGMPELAMDGPAFDDIGSRLHPAWMTRWVHDPHALRPTTAMPRVFGNALEDDQRLADITAYLSSLSTNKQDAAKSPDVEGIQAGTRLFANLGCIGCHLSPTEEKFEDDKQRISLRDVGAKWKPAALEAFLRKPEAYYQWIRMPNFNLSAAEAANLAAFLGSAAKREVFVEPKKGDPVNGKKLVLSSGCLNCHALAGAKSNLTASPYKSFTSESWAKGCMAEAADNRVAPVFNLTPEQKAALAAFGKDPRHALERESAVEFASRQMGLLRCQACHRRGEQTDFWSQLRDEEMGLQAALPPLDPESEPKQYIADQTRPTLTWVGEKLKPEWLTKLFAGQLDYKPRSYLRARMPAFPQRAELLAQGLVFEHGCPPVSPADALPDPTQVEIGKNLASKTRWNCASCHDVGKTAAVGVFEAPGPNFMRVKERLRPEYFERWLWNPLRVEPGTKMPTPYFWGQPSQVKDVLGGDPGKQIDALWNYLLLGEQITPPPQ